MDLDGAGPAKAVLEGHRQERADVQVVADRLVVEVDEALVLTDDALVPVWPEPAVFHAPVQYGCQGLLGDVAYGQVHVRARHDFPVVVDRVDALDCDAPAGLSVGWGHVREDVVLFFKQLQVVYVLLGAHPRVLVPGRPHRLGQGDVKGDVFGLAVVAQVLEFLREHPVLDDACGYQ